MGTARRGGCVIAFVPEVAGEAGVGLTFSLALAAMLEWVCAWGLLLLWTVTLGAMLEGIANAVKIDAWKIHLDPAGALRTVDHNVRKALKVSIADADNAIGFWLHQSARLQGWITDELFDLSRDTLHFGQWLIHQQIPTVVRYALDAAFPWPKVIRLIEAQIAKLLPKVGHVAHEAAHEAATPIYRTIVIPHLGELQWVHRHWKALTALVAGAGAAVLHPGLAIPRLWRGIDDAESDIRKLARRVTRTEALLGATAMALAMANVLGLRSANCLRKGPIGKVSRALCGLSSHALNDLLGLLADVLIVADICEVITLLNEGLTVLEGPLAELTSVAGAALCHGDYSEPAAMPDVPLYVPSGWPGYAVGV